MCDELSWAMTTTTTPPRGPTHAPKSVHAPMPPWAIKGTRPSRAIYILIPLSLSIYLAPSLYLYHYPCTRIYLLISLVCYLSLSLCLPPSLSLYIYLCIHLPLYIVLSLSISLFLSLDLYVHRCRCSLPIE